MSRLSDLYKAMETLRNEGLSLNEDLERQVSELEEDIIKKEILPVVTETIEPALKQVQRDLVAPKQAYVSIGKMAQYCKSMMLQQHLLLLSLKQG